MPDKLMRGFALLSPEKRTENARKAALAVKNRYVIPRELNAAGGRIGGKSKNPNKGYGTTKANKGN